MREINKRGLESNLVGNLPVIIIVVAVLVIVFLALFKYGGKLEFITNLIPGFNTTQKGVEGVEVFRYDIGQTPGQSAVKYYNGKGFVDFTVEIIDGKTFEYDIVLGDFIKYFVTSSRTVGGVTYSGLPGAWATNPALEFFDADVVKNYLNYKTVFYSNYGEVWLNNMPSVSEGVPDQESIMNPSTQLINQAMTLTLFPYKRPVLFVLGRFILFPDGSFYFQRISKSATYPRVTSAINYDNKLIPIAQTGYLLSIKLDMANWRDSILSKPMLIHYNENGKQTAACISASETPIGNSLYLVVDVADGKPVGAEGKCSA